MISDLEKRKRSEWELGGEKGIHFSTNMFDSNWKQFSFNPIYEQIKFQFIKVYYNEDFCLSE